MDIALRPAVELASMIRTREIGSRELLEHYLQRVERFNPALNAIVATDLDRARRRADEADAALARGEVWGPLHGLPMTIKELFEVEGFPWTAGDPQFAERVAEVNSPAVERLVAAGGVVFGVTNSPLNGMDVQTYNEVYGTTNNPWDTTRSSGGSSGGTAVVLATGMSALDLGSDIGGSIRNPAHYNGIYGHKPTFNLVPRKRLRPPGFMATGDLSVAGPLGRSAEDLDLELSIIAGPEADMATAWRLELPPPRRASLRSYRVAAWLDDDACRVDADVLARLQAAVSALREAGVEVNEEARPAIDFAETNRIYRSLLAGNGGRSLTGETLEAAITVEDALPSEDAAEPPLVQRNGAQRHREWMFLNEKREQIRYEWAQFFRDYDVLLMPVTPVTAIEHDHGPAPDRTISINGEQRNYFDQLSWVGLITMAYLPASVAPVGLTDDGLPVGIQIVGPHLEDRTPIDFARRLSEVVGGYVPPPGYA